jgi:hypothetical protein
MLPGTVEPDFSRSAMRVAVKIFTISGEPCRPARPSESSNLTDPIMQSEFIGRRAMQNRWVPIVNVNRALTGFVTMFIGLAEREPAFDTTATPIHVVPEDARVLSRRPPILPTATIVG